MSTSEPKIEFPDAQDAWEAEVRRPIRKLLRLTVVLLILTSLVAFHLCEDRILIDRNSGRLKIERALGRLVISDTVIDTGFSRNIAPGSDWAEDWRVLQRMRLLSSSIENPYPGVAGKLREFESLCNERGIVGDDRVVLAHQVLDMIKQDREAEIDPFLNRLRREHPVEP